MDERTTDPLTDVADYFSQRIEAFGPTALGVDWNTEQRQRLCFDQLANLFTCQGGFSVNDLGCGYGALRDYLDQRYQDVSYYGYDISEAMVRTAMAAHGDRSDTQFLVSARPLNVATYSVACGIFNVRVHCEDTAWQALIYETLDALFDHSTEGFAFNCLTTYSDPGMLKPYLFYADPCEVFDHCKRRYSRNVALLHDYDAYEFTVLVRKGPRSRSTAT